MPTRYINTLLSHTSMVLGEQAPGPVVCGQAFAREVPITPCEVNVTLTIDLPGGRQIEFLLSAPAPVADWLCGLERPTPQQRAAALAERVRTIVERSAGSSSGVGVPGVVRVVLGRDVVLGSLRTPGRRICVPWQSSGGCFVVEAGVR